MGSQPVGGVEAGGDPVPGQPAEPPRTDVRYQLTDGPFGQLQVCLGPDRSDGHGHDHRVRPTASRGDRTQCGVLGGELVQRFTAGRPVCGVDRERGGVLRLEHDHRRPGGHHHVRLDPHPRQLGNLVTRPQLNPRVVQRLRIDQHADGGEHRPEHPPIGQVANRAEHRVGQRVLRTV
ncbi:hypothetical protein BBK14_28990 [Parafrankia soli]|uniref:Uncharacterized protein n=1 Tax=Parafrankia soli TaxID=2599596 RepID=A0A1S1PEQ2_9ACTN|nr:hypothetical protein BBK14_28990 [Parafrankia soli]